MTQKEKAEELINKFIPHTKVFHEVLGWEEYIDSAKECALIAVDEILKVAVCLASAVIATCQAEYYRHRVSRSHKHKRRCGVCP